MKNLLFLSLLLAFSSVSLQAQHAQPLPAIYENAEALTLRYQLDAEQQQEIERIITGREQNLASIESLREHHEATYWLKRKAVYLGEQASIRMVLSSEAQLSAFAEVRKTNRIEESRVIKSLLADGHDQETTRLLLLQLIY